MSRAMFLFARPSFLEGVGRVMDFGGTLNVYNGCATPEGADARALRADVTAVTDDLRSAVKAISTSAR